MSIDHREWYSIIHANILGTSNNGYYVLNATHCTLITQDDSLEAASKSIEKCVSVNRKQLGNVIILL